MTVLSQPEPIPDIPGVQAEALVADAMDSGIMAADLKRLVMQVQQGNDWSTLACDEMLPQFIQQWSYALGREAVRQGWKAGYRNGRDGTTPSPAQLRSLSEPIQGSHTPGDATRLAAEVSELRQSLNQANRKLRTQGMELMKAKHLARAREYRKPLNDNMGDIERLNLWMMGESIRDMMWHVMMPHLAGIEDPDHFARAQEDLTRAIESQGQTVTHDLVMAGWHYGYAAAHEDPLIWQDIHDLYRQWALKYDAFHWSRPGPPPPAPDKPEVPD
jgi:hypothetical protein